MIFYNCTSNSIKLKGCIDDESQLETAMPQKLFSSDSRFRLSLSCPPTEFFRDISAIFGQSWKIISLLNSSNFSTLDRMDETNSQNPFFPGLGFSYLGFLTSVGLRPQIAHLRSIRFLSVPLVCTKSFPLCSAQEIPPFFCSGTLETSGKFHNSRVCYPYGFATDSAQTCCT